MNEMKSAGEGFSNLHEQEQRTDSSQLAAGIVSVFDKINIIISGDSTRLGVGVYALWLRVHTCRGELQIKIVQKRTATGRKA